MKITTFAKTALQTWPPNGSHMTACSVLNVECRHLQMHNCVEYQVCICESFWTVRVEIFTHKWPFMFLVAEFRICYTGLYNTCINIIYWYERCGLITKCAVAVLRLLQISANNFSQTLNILEGKTGRSQCHGSCECIKCPLWCGIHAGDWINV